MQVRGPSDIELLEEEEEQRREQEDGRWWTDWMCGCRESGGQGHGQVRLLSPGFTAGDHLLIVRRRDGPTRLNDFQGHLQQLLHLRIAVLLRPDYYTYVSNYHRLSRRILLVTSASLLYPSLFRIIPFMQLDRTTEAKHKRMGQIGEN